MFTRLRYEYVTDPAQMQQLLEYAKKWRYIIFDQPEIPLKYYAYVEDSMSYVKLTMRKDETPVTFIFRKDSVKGREQVITGLDAYIELCREFRKVAGYKIPEMKGDYGSARAILTKKKSIEGKRIEGCYAYDVNSAYGKAMTFDMPDTRQIAGEHREVEDGEVGFINIERSTYEGFYQAEGQALQMVLPHEGKASYVFKTIPSPFISFANRWYERKLTAQTPYEKAKAKQMMNFAVGYLQKKNPFLRAAVVEYSNRFIDSFVDNSVIYMNTDSIVCTCRRHDIVIGNEMGQFKLEHRGSFASRDFNYQWDLGTPTYRGVPKSWFPEGWDILKDAVPANGNEWELDKIKLMLYNNKELQNDKRNNEDN